MTDAFTEGQIAQIGDIAREVAREEVKSLAGLVLRRLQDDDLTRDPEHNKIEDVLDERLSVIFGEVLSGGYGDGA